MYPVSGRFLPRLAESHTPATLVQLFTTDGRVITVDHTGGSVSVDRGQAIRRTCTVTSADVSLIPLTPADQLATYGARLRIARGVEYGDGTQELVPLGVFRLDGVEGDPVEGPVTLTGKSLECIVADDKFTAPYQATGTVVGAISALVTRSIPDAQVISQITDSVIGPRTWDTDGDPWAACQEVAAAAGAECYANADGVFVISILPDVLAVNPVWAVEAGEGGVYVKGTRSMSSDGVFNGVLARGEGTGAGAPVQYLATDDDPGSPTYWGGPFGHRPTTYSSSTLTTLIACSAAANLRLRSAKAPNSRGDLSSLPNPALEPGDVIRVTHPDGLRELHQIASYTVPLDDGGDFPIATISAKEDS
ncbi:DUF5047 domain-containing protein [Streptomyces sp. NBC_00264]|uniref:DUF5047 domain-containing protein n=1 Tax=unclassified Streptomyces TaxID=2593676 RepID=UPI002253B43C|nr:MULTISPECIES: DUF5047 domain-containing protein [unclassified Streptomyces]MCX5158074.1 DUF5047 domain-containing protein [Streptomyces sp. NBC_00305]MCX5216597.1 DUF5047 domain-containing protein [Streptomyces sp. NBC_00264]